MLVKREQLKNAISHHFEEQGIVALAFPAITALPPKIGEEAEVEIGGKRVSFFVAFGRNTALSPVAGMAGLVLPAGLSAGGLPIGLEFDALAGNDRNLVGLGLSLEEALGSIPLPASEPRDRVLRSAAGEAVRPRRVMVVGQVFRSTI